MTRTFRYTLLAEDRAQWGMLQSRERFLRELVRAAGILGFDRLEVLDDEGNVLATKDVREP